ncbi:MAG: ABC transporter substrate-binding protein [Caulobacteraceae bacterium]|nr:ABC transporter substrate-binding protein [Caulobacteraceae bacterium]
MESKVLISTGRKSTPARLRFATAIAAAALALTPVAFAATPADPAAAKVDTFDNALIAAMKAGASAGAKGREREIAPAVQAAFDIPTMMRYAVGPSWNTMTEAQHTELSKAFERYTSANYAHNFDSYSGQKFIIQGVTTRGTDKIVQAQLTSPHGSTNNLIYRLHETPEGWKIIDVYYNGISQLTTRRSDFAAPLASGGASGLLSHLDALTAKLLI